MTDALESAVSGLSDPSVALPDALRGLLVVSRRIGADELTRWLRYELNGYHSPTDSAEDPDPDLPTYRSGGWPIRLGFDGPMRSSDVLTVAGSDLPNQLGDFTTDIGLREPIAELEALANGSSDPQLQLPTQWIHLYREAMVRGEVPHPSMHVLNRASLLVPRTRLRGILDQIRTKALDLVLGIEQIAPKAGKAGGPTVAENPGLGREIHIHMTNIYSNVGTVNLGDNATISTGDGATIASGAGATAVRVEVGDLSGLLAAARSFIGDDGVRALREAIEADEGEPAGATKTFLEQVKAGSYALVSGITTNAAYDALVGLLHSFSGGGI